jgi:FSR family fosmidomycin resistance protein-like MFS transporter
MIQKLAGDNIGKGMSFYMMGGEIARTLGPLVVLGAVSLWGLEGIWKLIPFGLLSSIVLFLKMRDMRMLHDFQRNQPRKNGVKETFMEFVPLFFIISGILLFQAIMKGVLITFLPTYITVKGGSLWFGGISLVILEGAGAVGTLGAGIISDRIGRKKVLIISSVLSPLFMWLFLMSNTLFVVPLLILLGVTVFAPGPVILAVVNERKNDHPSFINGTYMMISFAISALTILFAGQMADAFGLEETFWISAIIALLSIPFTVKLRSS